MNFFLYIFILTLIFPHISKKKSTLCCEKKIEVTFLLLLFFEEEQNGPIVVDFIEMVVKSFRSTLVNFTFKKNH